MWSQSLSYVHVRKMEKCKDICERKHGPCGFDSGPTGSPRHTWGSQPDCSNWLIREMSSSKESPKAAFYSDTRVKGKMQVSFWESQSWIFFPKVASGGRLECIYCQDDFATLGYMLFFNHTGLIRSIHPSSTLCLGWMLSKSEIWIKSLLFHGLEYPHLPAGKASTQKKAVAIIGSLGEEMALKDTLTSSLTDTIPCQAEVTADHLPVLTPE